MLYSDINEVKALLNVPNCDTSQDLQINFCLEWACGLLEEWLNRPGLSLQSRTEFYDGTGTQRLCLRHRPVFTTPEIECYVSYNGYWGEGENPQDPQPFHSPNAQLVYGQDFVLRVRDQNEPSRSGILLRVNNLWPKPTVRQSGWLSPFITRANGNIKVVYTAGWTVDTLPGPFRAATILLVNKMLSTFPEGLVIGGESYEERHVSYLENNRGYFLSLVKPWLFWYRNWSW